VIDFFKTLRNKWDDWCGDHEMETEIRRHLNENGYFGRTAKLRAVRLVAVQRPGWIQVFRFEATARVNPGVDDDQDAAAEYHELYGLVRGDQRQKRTTTRVFACETERRSLFRRWSEDLICLRGSQGLI